MVSGLAASRALTMARPMPLLAPVTRILFMAVSVYLFCVFISEIISALF